MLGKNESPTYEILCVGYSMSSVSGNAEISHMPHFVKACVILLNADALSFTIS